MTLLSVSVDGGMHAENWLRRSRKTRAVIMKAVIEVSLVMEFTCLHTQCRNATTSSFLKIWWDMLSDMLSAIESSNGFCNG